MCNSALSADSERYEGKRKNEEEWGVVYSYVEGLCRSLSCSRMFRRLTMSLLQYMLTGTSRSPLGESSWYGLGQKLPI